MRRCTSNQCLIEATSKSRVFGLDLPVAGILHSPSRDWSAIAKKGGMRVAGERRALDVDWKKFNIDDFLFSHCTIVTSVKTADNGFWIEPPCEELVNANGNAWTTPVLLATFKSFGNAENYYEHVQVPELSKGKILDAVLRPVVYVGQTGLKADVMYCFVGDSKVLMWDGSVKEIKDIVPGDNVVSGEGVVRSVLATSCRMSSDIVKVKVRGVLDEFGCTSGHKIWSKKDISDEWQLTEAGSVSRNDWVLQPTPLVQGKKTVNLDLAWLVGFYAAEGSLVERKNKDGDLYFSHSQFSCHVEESSCVNEVANRVLSLFGPYDVPFFTQMHTGEKIFKKVHGTSEVIQTSENGSCVRVGHRSLAETMNNLCGRGSTTKKISDEIVLEWDENSKLHFLAGLIDGDGCCRRNVVSLKLSNNTVIRQVEFILSSLKMAYSTTGQWHDGPYSGCATIELDCYSSDRIREFLRIKNDFDSCPETLSMGNRASLSCREGIARRVECVTKVCSLVEVPVYNITVDVDHNYVVSNVKVKNCDILVATSRTHGELVERIESGELSTMSMGCLAHVVQCSKCGKEIKDDGDNCEHLDNEMMQEFVDPNGVRRVVSELCGRSFKRNGEWVGDPESLEFIEASWVEKPAFKGAVINHMISEPDLERQASSFHMWSSEKLASLFEDVPHMRVADTEGMLALRVARQVLRCRREEHLISRVARASMGVQ